jgi:hypothetical protein
VQHDFLLHLLLFISRSSGTLRSMICLGCLCSRQGNMAANARLSSLPKPLALSFYRACRVHPVRP